VRKDLAGGYPQAFDGCVLSLPPLALEVAQASVRVFPPAPPISFFFALTFFFLESKDNGCLILKMKHVLLLVYCCCCYNPMNILIEVYFCFFTETV
jgi:hypothetical protein